MREKNNPKQTSLKNLGHCLLWGDSVPWCPVLIWTVTVGKCPESPMCWLIFWSWIGKDSGQFVWNNRSVYSCSFSLVWQQMPFLCYPCVFEAIVRHYTQSICELREESQNLGKEITEKKLLQKLQFCMARKLCWYCLWGLKQQMESNGKWR